MKIDGNFQREYWELFLEFAMAAAHIDPSDKKRSVLAMEVDTVTTKNPKFWKWSDQILDATLGTRPTISPVTNMGGTSKIDKFFWENLTRVIGIRIGEMIQSQQNQHQPTSTPSAEAVHMDFYSDWELAVLMGYAQVYTESGTSRIWDKFQMSKECADNFQ